MAEQSKPFFNIDAKKILATLHLAGQSQVTIEGSNQSIINTAIKNPVNKGDPAKLGNTEFDFSSDTYQVASGHLMQYKLPIVLELNKDLATAYEEFKKLDEDNKKQLEKNKQKNESINTMSFSDYLLLEANDEEGADKGLLDKNENNKKDDNNDNNEESSDSSVIAKATNEKLYAAAEKLITIYGEYAAIAKNNKKFVDLTKLIEENTKEKIKIKDKNDKDVDSEAIKNFKQIDKLFLEAIEEENKINTENYDKSIQEILKKNVENLKAYFNSFCGKESANAINEQNVVLKPGDVEGDFEPEKFKYIKDFKIDFETIEKECKIFDEKYQADVLKNKNKEIQRTMLCIVSYEVNKDTM